MKYNNPTSNGWYNTLSNSVSNMYQKAKENARNIGLAATITALTFMPSYSANAGQMGEGLKTPAPKDTVLLTSLYNIQASHRKNIAGFQAGLSKEFGARGWTSGVNAEKSGVGISGSLKHVADDERTNSSEEYFSNPQDIQHWNGAVSIPFGSGQSLTGLFSREDISSREAHTTSGGGLDERTEQQHREEKQVGWGILNYDATPNVELELIGGIWKNRAADTTRTRVSGSVVAPNGKTITPNVDKTTAIAVQEDGHSYGLGATYNSPHGLKTSARVIGYTMSAEAMRGSLPKITVEQRKGSRFDFGILSPVSSESVGFYAGATAIGGDHESSADHKGEVGGALGVWSKHAGVGLSYDDNGYHGKVSWILNGDGARNIQSDWVEGRAVQTLGLPKSLEQTLNAERTHALLSGLGSYSLSATIDGLPGDGNNDVGLQLLLPFTKEFKVGMDVSGRVDLGGKHKEHDPTSPRAEATRPFGESDRGIEAVFGLKNGGNFSFGFRFSDDVADGESADRTRSVTSTHDEQRQAVYFQLELPWGAK